MSEALSAHTDLSAVHFITHGTDASVRLGTSTLNNETIANFQDDLTQWSDSLTEDGDILFYGCNLAETEAGKALVNSIAVATNADVAASEDLTGHESLNGDWKLEFSVGDINTCLLYTSPSPRDS